MTKIKVWFLAMALGVAAHANAVLVNVASSVNGGVATQSSTLGSPGHDGLLQTADRAIDGDTNGDWYTGKRTHTESESQPWWQVALGGGLALVREIDVWGRTDCCLDRMDGFDVFLLRNGLVVWSALGNDHFDAAPVAVFLPPGVLGDTVKVQLQGRNYFSLAEVQVVAEVPEPASNMLLVAAFAAFALARRRFAARRAAV